MLISNDGCITLNLYKKNGLFCAAPEELKGDTTLVYDVITGETLERLLFKLHERYALAIEEIDPDTLFIEEIF